MVQCGVHSIIKSIPAGIPQLSDPSPRYSRNIHSHTHGKPADSAGFPPSPSPCTPLVLAWLSAWSEVQTCIWPSWCHCRSLSLASVKSRLVLPFCYRLTVTVKSQSGRRQRVLQHVLVHALHPRTCTLLRMPSRYSTHWSSQSVWASASKYCKKLLYTQGEVTSQSIPGPDLREGKVGSCPGPPHLSRKKQ